MPEYSKTYTTRYGLLEKRGKGDTPKNLELDDVEMTFGSQLQID